MRIDVYLEWHGMTKNDKDAQITGFEVSQQAGAAGYLREAYHGGPYVTKVLAPECWQSEDQSAALDARTLRARLPDAIATAHKRAQEVYDRPKDPAMEAALTAFVELAERRQEQTKRPVQIVAWY